MGKSLGRERYFEKHIRNTPDQISYINALKNSPYKQHQEAAVNVEKLVERFEKEEEVKMLHTDKMENQVEDTKAI